MRAAVVTAYGSPEVVDVRQVDEPEAGRRRVVVEVESAAVSSGDARMRAARFPAGFAVPGRLALGLRRPRRNVLGVAIAGRIAAVGADVEGWSVDDAVASMVGMRLGGHAERVAVAADRLVARPPSVSADDAAAVLFGGTTALHFLRRAGVTEATGPGCRLLVNGAAGAIGTNAVQLAARHGASVTAVCRGANADLVRTLGASDVIDHTTTDLRMLDRNFDVVFDTVGNLSIADGRALMAPGGRVVLAVAGLGEMIRARGPIITGTAPERTEDVTELLDLVAAGTLRTIIDSTYALEDIVEAHRRVDTGRKVGNVLVRPIR